MTGQHAPHLFVAFDGRLPRDVRQRVERLSHLEDVRALAVLPDVHIAGDFCVGVALATSRLIYPGAVGSDIGCGMACECLGMPDEPFTREQLWRVLELLWHAVPFHLHRQRQRLPIDPGLLSSPSLTRVAERDGAVEFGTLGGGNHFLELQHDSHGQLWLTVHTGSRCVGSNVFAWHRRSGDAIDSGSAGGESYLSDHEWCRAYARASRGAILERAAAVIREVIPLRADGPAQRTECDHNHVRWEEHFGQRLLVHRKGVTPAAEGEAGVIAGTMATRTYLTRGRGYAGAMASSSHGAGRVMTRAEARKRITLRDLQRSLAGIVYDARGGHSLVEEAPQAYRDIRRVMRAQADLTRIELELRPLLIHKSP
jgi:tRNA-splicing ligase RtcB